MLNFIWNEVQWGNGDEAKCTQRIGLSCQTPTLNSLKSSPSKSIKPMRSQLALITIPISIIWTLVAAAFAQHGAPELQALQQLGCKSGQALLPISGSVGQALAGTSMDLKHHGLAPESIPPDAEPGLYQIRAYGPNGLSNSRNLMVTRIP